MKRTLLSSSLLLFLCACPGAPAPDSGPRASQLADKLVACQNEQLALKERLGAAQGEVARLKGQLSQRAPEAPAPPRAARSAPRRHHARDSAAEAPAVRHGPTNPAAEAKAAQEMAQILRSQGGHFRPCYERGLKRNANLQYVSQIKVRLTVTPEGRARDVHTSPRTEGDMEACMAQVASHWHVKPYKGQPVVVELPVNLKVQQ